MWHVGPGVWTQAPHSALRAGRVLGAGCIPGSVVSFSEVVLVGEQHSDHAQCPHRPP